MLVLCGSPLTVTWGWCCVTLIMPTTGISSWLVMGHVCILSEWVCLWCEHISCPLGVVVH